MDNISPIDGRYKKYTQELVEIFSESAFIRQRLLVEIKYFIFLLNLNILEFPYNRELHNLMIEICETIPNINIGEIKDIENTINHDVKSIEYYLANRLRHSKYDNYVNLLHFGLTSQDVNTMAYSISLSRFNDIFKVNIEKLMKSLQVKIINWDKIIIVGRTHGQPATWTLLGKEFNVFYAKLADEFTFIADYKFTAKFGGAVGNMTSHKIFADLDWCELLNNFVENFGLKLKRSEVTTQIHNYNEYSQYFDGLKRICSILIDMCVDIWLYCSFRELKLIKPKMHVGSSIMPHKVNPIEFENAEGNLKIAEMWLQFMSRELCKSRLQRDLTDSTIMRNLGVVFGHILIGIKNICKGLAYLEANTDVIEQNLYDNISSMSEIDQHILRKANDVNGYNTIKDTIKDTPDETMSKKELVDNYKKYILH